MDTDDTDDPQDVGGSAPQRSRGRWSLVFLPATLYAALELTIERSGDPILWSHALTAWGVYLALAAGAYAVAFRVGRNPIGAGAFAACVLGALFPIAFVVKNMAALGDTVIFGAALAALIGAAAVAWIAARVLKSPAALTAIVLCGFILVFAVPSQHLVPYREAAVGIVGYLTLPDTLGSIAVLALVVAALSAATGWVEKKEPGIVALGAAITAVWAAAAAPAPSPRDPLQREHGTPPSDAMNVFVVSMDSLRFDRLRHGAEPGGPLRFAEQLLARSTSFDRAYAPGVQTFPSLPSIFTGRRASDHGLYVWNTREEYDLAGGTTFPYELSRAGWRTAMFYGMATDVFGGLERHFDHYVAGSEPGRFTFAPQAIAGLRTRAKDKTVPVEVLYDEARTWIEGLDGRPFVAFLHDMTAHFPFQDRPLTRPVRSTASVEELRAHNDFWPTIDPTSPRGRETAAALTAAYDDELARSDEALEDFVGWLDETGRLERTIVVITADHGESLGEKGVALHGRCFFDEVARVPLVIRDPRTPEPRRIDTAVSLRDLFPTLGELAGATVPGVPGTRSLVPLMRGTPDAAGEPVFVDHHNGTAVIWRGKKLVRIAPSWVPYLGTVTLAHRAPVEVFDLVADPQEAHDLAPSFAELDVYVELLGPSD